jgi:hypothetical protein
MPRRTTKTKPLEDQAAALQEAQQIYLNATKQRDDARAEVTLLQKQLDAVYQSPIDTVCARLAVILLPQEDPTLVEPSELEIEIKNREDKSERVRKILQKVAGLLDPKIDKYMDAEELADAIEDAAKDTIEDKERLTSLEEDSGGEEELADLVEWQVKSEYTPEQMDKAIEILEHLGIYGNTLGELFRAGDIENELRFLGYR